MRIRSACVMVALALGATVLGVGTADATGPLSGTKVRNWQTGYVLGVAGNSTVGGAEVQYQADTNDLAQKWAIDPVTRDTFLLRNLNSDMCVTAVAGGDTEPLQQRPCDSRWEEQTFTMADSGKPNRYQLRNLAHSKCMHPYASTAPTYPRLYACSTTTWQAHSFDVR
ncbi:RICIN domain-containing protein [Streptomyces sp. NEAU-Y11]|uniref:RICIN domain-containing protein n=1 Tax=Streptomyces cucumeris TaxID=2962890 RepID=UPI0020C8B6D3|nr:RICIN domain-containing protein [Streptomyces sp. NEAU-Y11]MCP9211517.1 RICIN domain-containing protein [Streptomyces sp. NEAU-Y11]